MHMFKFTASASGSRLQIAAIRNAAASRNVPSLDKTPALVCVSGCLPERTEPLQDSTAS